jgi:hypothetical protein
LPYPRHRVPLPTTYGKIVSCDESLSSLLYFFPPCLS